MTFFRIRKTKSAVLIKNPSYYEQKFTKRCRYYIIKYNIINIINKNTTSRQYLEYFYSRICK